MSLLLDTHVLIWALASPERLRPEARQRITDADEVVFVSSVSAWEIEIKRALGKLKAPHDLAEQVQALRFTELPLHFRHVQAMAKLPKLHRDPFDRALIGQAVADGLVFVTADEMIQGYPVKTLQA